jgi:hypothetical protein
MNSRTLLEDAAALWMLDRKEGALLLVLIAVAATARKRYPRPISDKESFIRFVRDHSEIVTGVEFDLPVPVPGKAYLPLSEVLYTFIRCHLVHEAAFPCTVRITDRFGHLLVVGIAPESDCLELPDGFVGTLAMAVQAAPENASIFAGAEVWSNPASSAKKPNQAMQRTAGRSDV